MDIYFTSENSDLTEGRGPMVITGVYLHPEQALTAVKGRGVQGVGDGEIHMVPMDTMTDSYTGRILDRNNLYYGYRKGRDGQWRSGFADLRDEPEMDPEYAEYLRLRLKFEK